MRDIFACLLLLFARLPLAVAAEDTSPPSIVHEPCEQYKKGQAFEIRARFIDESAIFDPKVIYRSGNEFWKNVPFIRDANSDEFKAVIKSKDLKITLEYFIEAFDENGNGPARYGSPDAPVKLVAATNPVPCQQVGEVNQMPAVHASSRPGAQPGAATVVGGKPAENATEPSSAATSAASVATAAPVVVATPSPPPPVSDSGPVVELQRLPPPPPVATCDRSDRPFYCSPWFWGISGAVVLGGGGVLGYMLLKKDDALPNEVHIQVSAPSPAASGLSMRLP